jgi:hypothetical protein
VLEGTYRQRTAMTFTVSLSTPSPTPVTAVYTALGATATPATDFGRTSGSLTFAPNETVKTIVVTVRGDRRIEPNETLFMVVLPVSGATATDPIGLGTILNDD